MDMRPPVLKLAPSILSADFGWLAEQTRRVEKGGADWVHIDVMDGHFVPNLTVGPGVVDALRRHSRLHRDVHLMIEKPWRYLEAFAAAGAQVITVHFEACGASRGMALGKVLSRIRCLGIRAGVSLKPKTPARVLLPWLSQIDLVLIMSVEPGFGGQSFMPEVLPKVSQFREIISRKRYKCDLEIDGGINKTTAPLAWKSGANVLVAGNAIFSAPDPAAATRALRAACLKVMGK